MVEIKFDSEKCNKCGICVDTCPFGILAAEKNELPRLVDAKNCMTCGQCAASCPTGAISHSSFAPGKIVPVNAANIPSPEQVLELLRSRRSVRSFRPDPVERDKLEKIVRMAAYAPTAHNDRSVEMVVMQDPAKIKMISDLTRELMEKFVGYMDKSIPRYMMKRQMKEQYHWMEDMRPAMEKVVTVGRTGYDAILHDAPAIIAFVSDPKKTYSNVNAQLAIQNALLAGEAVGLGSFYCGFASSVANRDPRFKEILGLPGDRSIDGIIAVGYPKHRFKNAIEREAKTTWL